MNPARTLVPRPQSTGHFTNYMKKGQKITYQQRIETVCDVLAPAILACICSDVSREKARLSDPTSIFLPLQHANNRKVLKKNE